jgi:hypothetical protein
MGRSIYSSAWRSYEGFGEVQHPKTYGYGCSFNLDVVLFSRINTIISISYTLIVYITYIGYVALQNLKHCRNPQYIIENWLDV